MHYSQLYLIMPEVHQSLTCMLEAEDAAKLAQGLNAAADSDGIAVLPPSVSLADDGTHIKVNGTLQTETVSGAKVFASANLNTGVPTFTVFISAEHADFDDKTLYKGGKTPAARAIEMANALAGPHGSLHELLSKGGALKEMYSKLPKGEGKKFKSILAGNVAKTLSEDCSRAQEPGEAPKNTWSQPVQKRHVFNDNEEKIGEMVQVKLPPTPLFVECDTEKTDEEIKLDLAKFHPQSELRQYQEANPHMKPTTKLKVRSADGQLADWTHLFVDTPYTSITLVAKFEVAPWKCFLSTKHSTDRIVFTQYLRSVTVFARVGKKRNADGDAGPVVNTAQKMVLDQFYGPSAGSSKRARSDEDEDEDEGEGAAGAKKARAGGE